MTKPASPSAGQGNANVVEIDAIDVAEWERDQYTPQAPAAGLAELVRQTLPQPIAVDSQHKPVASEGRVPPAPRPATPPARAPAAARTNLVPSGKPAVLPRAADKHSAALQRALMLASNDRPAAPPPATPIASNDRPAAPPLATPIASNDRPATAPRTQSIASNAPTTAPPRTSDDRASALPHVSPFASTERITAPPDVPPVPSPLPSPGPSPLPPPEPRPVPTASPSPLPPPMRIEAEVSRGASSDPTPPMALGRAASPQLDGTASLAIVPRFTSRRGIMLGGAAAGVVLLVIAIAATRGGNRTATPEKAPALTQTRPVTAPQRPARAAETPAPSTRDTSGAGASVATATPADAPDASSAPQSSQLPAPPQPGTRKIAKAATPPPDQRPAPIAPDDEVPATARARAAYNEGNQALFVGNSDAAIRAYRLALSAAPTFPPGFRGLGLAYAQKGQNGLAIMSLRTYLTMAPHARDAALIKQRIAALQSSEP